MTNKIERLEEIKKELEDIGIQRNNLWVQEDKIKRRHEILRKRNSELVTEYLKLKGVTIPQ